MSDAQTPSGSEQPNRGPDSERLLALLELAEEGSRELDAQVARHTGFTQGALGKERTAWWRDPEGNRCGFDWFTNHPPQFTTSLDAAMTLTDDRCVALSIDTAPGDGSCAHASVGRIHFGHADTMPLALCIAALKANATTPKSAPSLAPTPARGASSPESSLPESNNQSETP